MSLLSLIPAMRARQPRHATPTLDPRAFEAIVENATDPICVKGLDGRYSFVNEAAARMLGRQRSEIVGRRARDVLPPALAEADEAIDRELLATGQAHAIEDRRAVGGQTRTFLVSRTPLRDAGGNVAAIATIARDVTELKEAARALRDREAHYRLLAEHAFDLIVETGPDGRFAYISPNVREVLGYEPADLLGTLIFDLIHPDDRALPMATFARGIESGASQQVLIRLRHRDGTYRWVESIGSTYVNAAGEPRRVIVTRDVTERREAEEARRRSERLYRVLIEKGADAVGLIDAEGRLRYVGPTHLTLTGWAPHERTGHDAMELIHPDDRTALAEALRELRRTPGASGSARFRALHKNGSWMWIEGTGTNMLDEPDVESIVVNFRDVTPAKLAEEVMRKNAALLAATMRSTGEGFLSTDTAGRVVFVNPRFLEMWGIPRDLVSEERLEDATRIILDQLADADAFTARARELEASGEQASDILRFKDGRVFERYSCPMLGDNGTVLGRVWSFRDVTERERLQAQFLQAQKMESIGRLAGGVAHDFNNLMTAIIGYAELALRDMPGDDPSREDLEEIRATAERAAGLTQGLLVFARRQVAQPRLVSLNEVIHGTQRMLQRLIGEDIELRFMPSHDLWLTSVDPGQFEQVLVNLAVNARDALPIGGTLTIATANATLGAGAFAGLPRGEYVRVTVADNGLGMTEEVRRHIFEPFFTTKPLGEGTGLGLATCYGIVTQGGGAMDAHSAPGRGTTFTIYLPKASAGAASQPAGGERAETPGGTETVLVVEDEQAIRDLAVRVLRSLGYTVLAAADGEAAVATVAAHGRLDLLLTDVVMPRAGGTMLARRLARERPGIKVLYMSGYAHGVVPQEDLSDRNVAFVPKPFGPTELARAVRELLDRTPA